MLHHVVWYKCANFTDILAAPIFPPLIYSDNEGSRHQWNYRRKQPSLSVRVVRTSNLTDLLTTASSNINPQWELGDISLPRYKAAILPYEITLHNSQLTKKWIMLLLWIYDISPTCIQRQVSCTLNLKETFSSENYSKCTNM